MPNRPSFWFRAAAFVAAMFVLTVFIMIAGVFSDPDLPINHWLNRHGISLLLGEVVLLLLVGFLAMLTDQPVAAQHDDSHSAPETPSQPGSRGFPSPRSDEPS